MGCMHRVQQRSPMYISTVSEHDTYVPAHPIPLLLICIGPCPELLDLQKQPYSVANFIYSHLLQHRLIHLQQILSIDIILPEQLLVLSAIDGHQPITYAFLIPISCGIRAIKVGEFGLGRTAKRLSWCHHGRRPSTR